MSSEATESPPASSKRPYTRRTPYCRLCLQQYAKDQLEEIFGRGSECQKRIFAAVAIKPNRNDRTTRLCSNCRNMVDVIVTFQQVCQQTDALLHEGRILGETSWQHATKLIGSIRELVEQHQDSVDNNIDNNVTTEMAQEIFIPEVTVEYLDCMNGEQSLLEVFNDELNIEAYKFEVKEEEEQDLSGTDQSEYVAPSDSHEQESEQDSIEEKPKKTQRGRKKNLVMTKRKTNNEKVICDTCGELVSQISLEGHLNRHLGVKPFICEIKGCGRQLYSKYSLQQHRHLHKTIMRYYDCPDCGKRIKGTSSWLRHKKLHTEDPKCTCDVCGKKFHRRDNLKLHSVVHTGVALFPCEICGKHFTLKHNLTAHYKTHMKNGTYPDMNK